MNIQFITTDFTRGFAVCYFDTLRIRHSLPSITLRSNQYFQTFHENETEKGFSVRREI